MVLKENYFVVLLLVVLITILLVWVNPFGWADGVMLDLVSLGEKWHVQKPS